MSGIELLLNGNRGRYIPRDFIFECYSGNKEWSGLTMDQQAGCSDVEQEWYWENWNEILRNAKYVDVDGHEWSLHQDGDLFAICDELMSDIEYRDFYGQGRE